MDKIYPAKYSLSGQNIYCKKNSYVDKVHIQKLASVNKTFTVKGSLGRQNIYYKNWLSLIKYIL